MEPQNMQATEDLTPEDGKAAMGIATALQDQMMQAPQQETQDNMAQSANAPTETGPAANVPEQDLQVEQDMKIEELENKFTDFQGEVKDMIKEQVDEIKQMLKDAMKDGE